MHEGPLFRPQLGVTEVALGGPYLEMQPTVFATTSGTVLRPLVPSVHHACSKAAYRRVIVGAVHMGEDHKGWSAVTLLGSAEGTSGRS